MAIVKQFGYRRTQEKGRHKNVDDYADYLEKGRIEGMNTVGENCSEQWVKDFELTAASWNKLTNNVAIEFIQSWDKEESARIGFARLQQVGVEAAQKAFPGHQFVVVPHLNDKGNYHNHVLICPVSAEDGKRLQCNFTERGRFTKETDKICLELGLRVQDRKNSALREKLSKEAHMMLRKSGFNPIQLQIMRAADVARTYSRSLEEYRSIMLSFNINVHDRGKALSYYHPDREKGIRDRSLGENYKKEGLNEQFSRNRKQFESRPGLHDDIARKAAEFDLKRGFLGNSSSFPFPPGGHQKFGKADGAQKGQYAFKGVEVHEGGGLFHHNSYLLRDVIESTRSLSVYEYCRANKIGLVVNEDGSHRLKGRPHILISGNEWKSTKEKNGKRVGGGGGLLEFVVNHQKISEIEALAKITGNDRLLLLQEHLGKVDNNYRVFSVPTTKACKEKDAMDLLGHLAKHLGKGSTWNRAISNYKNVRVSTEGAVLFLLGKNPKGAVKHSRNSAGMWVTNSLGSLHSAFDEQSGTSSKLHVFSDPFTFMDATKGRGLLSFSKGDNVLVLGGSNTSAVDFFIAKNAQVKDISFIGIESRSVSKFKLLEFEKHGLNVTFSMPGDGIKGKEKGPELGL